MNSNENVNPTDLVLVVWPRQSEPEVLAGARTWQEVSSSAWAMDASKADRVRVLLAVYDDVIRGAWRVEGVEHSLAVPEGKTRTVNRSSFVTVEDKRLEYLDGMPSPLPRRRNPQATMEIRDLPGSDRLTAAIPVPVSGTVQLGDFVLTVTEAGAAELVTPRGAAVSVRPR